MRKTVDGGYDPDYHLTARLMTRIPMTKKMMRTTKTMRRMGYPSEEAADDTSGFIDIPRRQ